MSLKIQEIGPAQLIEYATILCRFTVTSIFQVELLEDGLDGIRLHEAAIAQPYIKDYDAYDEIPSDWPVKYDVKNWGFFLAKIDGNPVGAAAVAFGTAGVFMLEDRSDISVLWDLRVKQEARGSGILLFRKAAEWSGNMAANR